MTHSPPITGDRRFSTKTARERANSLYRSEPSPPRAITLAADPPFLKTARGAAAPPDLTPVKDPLTPEMARHLLRRTAFGAEPLRMAQLVGMPADDAVRTFVSATPPGYRRPGWSTVRPPHANASDAAFEEFFELNDAWMGQFIRQLLDEWATGGIQGRMMLFWHDHFASSFEKYELAAFAVRQMELFRSHATGSFESLVNAIGKDPAMLIYLDGYISDRHAPNENYARELLELFTMGRLGPDGTPNYTEHDIVEIARALTGWTVNWTTMSPDFYPSLFDSDTKSIFGQQGRFAYDDVIDIIFRERSAATAHYLCWKLYREFVHQEPDPEVIRALATELQNGGFNIRHILLTLLSSHCFFDSEGTLGARIKSPVELLLGHVKEVGLSVSGSLSEALYWGAAEMDQQLFFPPNVAGWPGHLDWLSTTSLPLRWSHSAWFAYVGSPGNDPELIAWANRLAPPGDGLQAFRLPAAIMQHMMPVPLEILGLPTTDGPLGGDLLQFPVPDSVRTELPREAVGLAAEMLSGTPWYEWNLEQPGAVNLLRFFLARMVERPEFQLM